MESHTSRHTKIAWAAASALILILLVLSWPQATHTTAAPLRQCPNPPICEFDPTCGCWIHCESSCPPGASTEVPPPPPGGTSVPQGTSVPRPTIPPPPYAPPGGYYATVCMPAGYASFCNGRPAIVTYYKSPDGAEYLIHVTCTENCTPATATPGAPVPTPTPYPCNQPPVPNGEGITQPCASQWLGYNLSVSVQIPPVNGARNPWPRSLVGLTTNFCFISAPSSVEQFSAQKAVPCSVDRGSHDSESYDCGSPAGTVSQGARVNYQLGVAWRRYTGSDPGFGTRPPFISALELEERSWNGGNQILPLVPGQCTPHTYETSSYGLRETFPPWNPVCQDRECEYTERTLGVQYTCETCKNCTCAGCVPAYSSIIQTWWWPEWTWRYDEYQCSHHTTECVPDPVGHRTCNGQADMKEHRVCDRWHWVSVTEPWNRYDVRRQGLPSPYVGSGKTNMAGMDPSGNVRTPFVYPPSVPVIEVQPVHP
jgi:hypothetical protein